MFAPVPHAAGLSHVLPISTDAVLRPVVEEARVPDELAVEVVREAQVRPTPNHARNASRLSWPLTRIQRQVRSILRDRPELVLVPRLERLEPDAPSLERYVKRQPSPSANARRMRRATTALCTSSGPS